MIRLEHKPSLIVVSAPSGAGKTTLCERLLEEFHETITYSVSCTTREPREGETHGKDYYFLSEDEFKAKIEADAFLEYARVHRAWYGTLRDHVLQALADEKDVLMDLDVQGVAQMREVIRRAAPDDPLKRAYVDIFIAPPSMEVLRRRLYERGKDDEDVIRRRLDMAEAEIRHWREFQYLIINDKLSTSYDAFRAIVIALRHRI